MPIDNIEENVRFLSRIVGEQLSAVCFVMDYLQLQFDGAGLTVLNPIVVRVEGRTYRLGDLSFRDSLCARITRIVENVFLSDDELRLDLDDSSSISISLRDEDYSGPEAINFYWEESGKQQLLVL